jgi:hypothetical protein
MILKFHFALLHNRLSHLIHIAHTSPALYGHHCRTHDLSHTSLFLLLRDWIRVFIFASRSFKLAKVHLNMPKCSIK